jgi:hypothetical protein
MTQIRATFAAVLISLLTPTSHAEVSVQVFADHVRVGSRVEDGGLGIGSPVDIKLSLECPVRHRGTIKRNTDPIEVPPGETRTIGETINLSDLDPKSCPEGYRLVLREDGGLLDSYLTSVSVFGVIVPMAVEAARISDSESLKGSISYLLTATMTPNEFEYHQYGYPFGTRTIQPSGTCGESCQVEAYLWIDWARP